MSAVTSGVLSRIARWMERPEAVWHCVALAFGLRAAVVLAVGDWRDPETWEYGMIARNLLEGRGYSGSAWFLPPGPTAFMAPGYVGLLYAVQALFGGGGFFVLQLAQCAVGAAAVGLLYTLALQMFASPSGAVVSDAHARTIAAGAALVLALNPLHVYTAVFMHPLVWTSAILVATVALLYRVSDAAHAGAPRSQLRRVVLLGVVYGIGLLMDPALLCIAPLFLVWPLAQGSLRWKALRWGAAALAVALCVISPWTIRNYLVFDRVVLLKSAFGYILWAGNHPGAPGTQTFVNELGEIDHVVNHVPGTLLAEIEGLSEPDAYGVFAREAINYMKRHPGRTVAMMGTKAMYFWWFPTWKLSPLDQAQPIRSQFRHPAQVVWAGVLALAAPGCWMARRRWRRWALAPAVLVCFTALYAVTTVSNGPRYRVPVEPLVMAFAGVTLHRAVHGRDEVSG